MRSMTAYACARTRKGGRDIQVVLRSLNFKYLDIIVHNLPGEDIFFEDRLKKEVKKAVARGRVEVFIFFNRAQPESVQVNKKVVAQYIRALKQITKEHSLSPKINASDILNLPQAVSWRKEKAGVQRFIQPLLKEAVTRLVAFKEKEGRTIKREIEKNLGKMEKNIAQIRRLKPRARQAESEKEDIDEEIALASFYLEKIGRRIKSSHAAPKGKALDFLTQEVSRELNAAASKTKKQKVSFLVVEAKNYLERIREQAQNIE